MIAMNNLFSIYSNHEITLLLFALKIIYIELFKYRIEFLELIFK